MVWCPGLAGHHRARRGAWRISVFSLRPRTGAGSFAVGLHSDFDAVTAGLTTDWNSGLVEGAVNRIKMLKRQMFGRAGFALLRKRVLLA